MQHNQFLLIIKCSIINKNTGSLCCTLETNTTLQINSIQLRETENGKILTLGYLICLLSILALFSIRSPESVSVYVTTKFNGAVNKDNEMSMLISRFFSINV